MLSRQEKTEMLNDAKSRCRKESFRLEQIKYKTITSFDEYISFLDSVQEIFPPFKTLFHPTSTALNKL